MAGFGHHQHPGYPTVHAERTERIDSRQCRPHRKSDRRTPAHTFGAHEDDLVPPCRTRKTRRTDSAGSGHQSSPDRNTRPETHSHFLKVLDPPPRKIAARPRTTTLPRTPPEIRQIPNPRSAHEGSWLGPVGSDAPRLVGSSSPDLPDLCRKLSEEVDRDLCPKHSEDHRHG